MQIAKAVARKNNYEISVNREIVAMGLANLIGGMFNCYTTTGSFSRTAVSSDVGARTQLQGVVSGALSWPRCCRASVHACHESHGAWRDVQVAPLVVQFSDAAGAILPSTM